MLRAQPAQSVDAIITDLPYGINKASWDVTIPLHWIDEAWRVTSRMLVMCGNPEFLQIAPHFKNVQGCIVLHARNGMTRSNISFGNWIAVLACGNWQWEARPNYIPFTTVTNEAIKHPSPKPLQAMMKLLAKYTHPDWLICDPFCGSGTTLVASQRLGRRFIGGDLSRVYVDEARKRLAQPYTRPMFEQSPVSYSA